MTFSFRSRDPRVVDAANDRMTTRYAKKVDSIAQRVPLGIDLLGFRRSPDMDAPANMPLVAGNRMPNRSLNVSSPLNSWLDGCGRKLDRSVAQLSPVNLIPRPGATKGCMIMADTGMLRMARVRMTRSPLLAFANIQLPARHRMVHTTKPVVSSRYSHLIAGGGGAPGGGGGRAGGPAAGGAGGR